MTAHQLLSKNQLLACLMIFCCIPFVNGQHDNRISRQIDSKGAIFQKLQKVSPFSSGSGRTDGSIKAKEMMPDATLMTMAPADLEKVFAGDENILVEIPFEKGSSLTLKLQKAEVFSSTFQLFTATDPNTPYPYERGSYYWGSVEGHKGSLVDLSFTRDEIMGFIEMDGVNYTLGKIEDDEAGTHILYKTDELPADPGISCYTDDTHDMSIRDQE